MTESSFSHKGGIETWFGAQNKAAIAAFNDRKIDPIPEDSERSELALTLNTIFPDDETIRVTENGFPWASFILPSGEGKFSKGTLVERWNENESAFGLRRALGEHIAGSYLPGGEQHANRIRAVRHVNHLLSKLQGGRLSPDEMQRLHEESYATLFDSHYINSTHPDRETFAQQVLRATQPDTKGRQNQPAGRVILTAGRPQLITDLTLDDIIAIKNLDRANEIDSECDFEELALRTIMRKMKLLASKRVGTGAFDDEDWKEFKKDAFHLLSPKTTILLQPYSALAARLRYGIFATDFAKDVITLGKYMDFKEAIEFSDTVPILAAPTLEERKRRIESLLNHGEAGLNNLIEKRYEGSQPKAKSPRRLNADERFWAEIDMKYSDSDE